MACKYFQFIAIPIVKFLMCKRNLKRWLLFFSFISPYNSPLISVLYTFMCFFPSLFLITWQLRSWLSRTAFETYLACEQSPLLMLITSMYASPLFETNSSGLLCNVTYNWVTLALSFLLAFHPLVVLLGACLRNVSLLLYQLSQLTVTAFHLGLRPPKIIQLASLQFISNLTRTNL